MFSQKKSFYQRKSFYGITLALLLAFGFWINHDPKTQGTGDLNEPVVNTGEQVPSTGQSGGQIKNTGNASRQWEHEGTAGGYGSGQSFGAGGGQNGGVAGVPYEGNGTGQPYGEDGTGQPYESAGQWGDGNSDNAGRGQGPCYLVKENDGYIKIYSVDEAGAQHLVRTTDISFSLLSESDQKLFQKGIVKQTKDELSNLLQDFES